MILNSRKPDFTQFQKVLKCEKPDRPVLFELFLNIPLYEKLSNVKWVGGDSFEYLQFIIKAFTAAGYDYTSTSACDMAFYTNEKEQKNTISLNEGCIITDRESYEAYKWCDPDNYDYSKLEKISPYLPDGMKLMIMGPGGVLENVISLVGYDNLCYMLYEDEELVNEIFNQVGSRLVRYYQNAVEYDTVGLLMANDDWGFNTQTFLSIEHMRKYVFPWHKKIVDVAHSHVKLAALHSCGNLNGVMDDVIDYMGFDAKHSFEDGIMPIEECYKKWGSRIALLGGMDVDFLIRSPSDVIYKRCINMLELSKSNGGYALGSGNSIPEYIPHDKYFAMNDCALI